MQRVYSYCVYLNLVNQEITAENICKEMGIDQGINRMNYTQANPFVDEFKNMKLKVESTIDKLVRYRFLERKLDFKKQRKSIGEGNPKKITIADLATILSNRDNGPTEEESKIRFK